MSTPDIGVYVRKAVLEHKQRDGKESDDRYCYWTSTSRADIRDGDKFWFASEGRWQGYFEVKMAFVMIEGEDQNHGPPKSPNPIVGPPGVEDNEVTIHDGMELRFYSDSWHPFDGGTRKPFQGFTYNVPTIRSLA